ncbi:transposase [Halorhodospira neutriphila]|uniref:transposase n=1 Tax=Halorhodospira neutriphila TaxID=168379 RepID=UPI0030841D69
MGQHRVCDALIGGAVQPRISLLRYLISAIGSQLWRCRLEPFKRLALTLKAHWQGILNAFGSRLSNGSVEGMNAQIQAAKARARGFRTTRNLITVCYLIGGKLTHLPASPYGTTCRPAAA